MSYTVFAPPTYLQAYIKQYWSVENAMHSTQKYTQRIIPTGLIEMSFYSGNKPEVHDNKKNIANEITIKGQLLHYYDLHIQQPFSVFSVLFTPLGASMYFKTPLHLFTDYNIALSDIAYDEHMKLLEMMHQKQCPEKKVALMNNYFKFHFLNKKQSMVHKTFVGALQNIHANELCNLSTLLNNTFLSKRQSERIFKQAIGITPKQFAKIIRFQQAIYTKQINPKISLTQLSAQCNYFDQSHMIHEFGRFAGLTPKNLFNEGEPFSDFFS